jgi:tRNA-Thr(GGU) m(6)t(6)A37 methyltransferase TsaA
MKDVTMTPIGTAQTPFAETKQIPKGPDAKHDAEGVIELRPDLEPGLQDIDGFSHLFVIWVFDRADGYDLIARPPTDDREHGVFASRSPRRPNPLALTVVELLRRATAATSTIASLNAASFALDGALNPLSLRTNCRDAAWISSSVAGGSKLNSVLMFRHMHFYCP